MQITLSYETLLKKLGELTSIVEDSMSSEDMKSVVFEVSISDEVNKLSMFGANRLISDKIPFSTSDTNILVQDDDKIENGLLYFQLKSKELNSYLGTFKGMSRTIPQDIELTIIKGRIRLKVFELDQTTNDIRSSNWTFDDMPVKPQLRAISTREVPSEEEFVTIESSKILFYTANLLPIMQNDSQSTMYSLLAFGSDFVVAFNPSSTTMIRNSLPAILQGISLNYKAISFMKNVLCMNETVSVARNEQFLIFKTENSVSHLTYSQKIPTYAHYIGALQRDHAIVLDRPYFKDVLKRLSLVQENIDFAIKVSDSILNVSNKKFNQDIQISAIKGFDSLGDISFRILPNMLSKAIIGDESAFDSDLRIYVKPQEKGGYTLIFADKGDQWFSFITIR